MAIVHKYHHYILESDLGHQRKYGQQELKEQPREVGMLKFQLQHATYSAVKVLHRHVSTDENDSGPGTRMSTPIWEVLLSEYSVHELPSECSEESALDITGFSGGCVNEASTNVIVHTALVARIEALEIENKELRYQVSSQSKPFLLSSIAHNDSLVHFYTGFHS